MKSLKEKVEKLRALAKDGDEELQKDVELVIFKAKWFTEHEKLIEAHVMMNKALRALS